MLVRAIMVGGFALLASAQVVRTAIVAAYGKEQPAIAGRVWPGHPDVNFAVAMAEIGGVAASGKSVVPKWTLRRVEQGSNAAPLAVEPFLIKGALAQAVGRSDFAERLFIDARARDPRSAAARYFLAERFLASGRTAEGLSEISVLARLVPGGSQLLVPALVRYARAPGSAAALKGTFAANPGLREGVLTILATDASNADLILRIAGPLRPGDESTPPPAWQGRLLNALVETGQFTRAQNLWTKVSGIVPATPTSLVNSGFAELNAPPPFNWSLGSGSFGIAEAAEAGQLKVIFYGREDAEMASQLLLLPPGQYRLQMQASRDAEGASGLEWSVTCLPSKTKLADIPLTGATLVAKRLGATFVVPVQGCAAQWLKLTGTAMEFPKSVQATIGKLELLRVSGR